MSKTLTENFYLALSRKGNWGLKARITRTLPALASGEIALALKIALPDALFQKPSLRASIEVPASAVSAPKIDSIVIDNIKETLQQQLGVNLEIAVVEPTATV